MKTAITIKLKDVSGDITRSFAKTKVFEETATIKDILNWIQTYDRTVKTLGEVNLQFSEVDYKARIYA